MKPSFPRQTTRPVNRNGSEAGLKNQAPDGSVGEAVLYWASIPISGFSMRPAFLRQAERLIIQHKATELQRWTKAYPAAQYDRVYRALAFLAARRNRPESLAVLLGPQVNANETSKGGESLLGEAARRGHQGCVDLLLAKGAHADLGCAANPGFPHPATPVILQTLRLQPALACALLTLCNDPLATLEEQGLMGECTMLSHEDQIISTLRFLIGLGGDVNQRIPTPEKPDPDLLLIPMMRDHNKVGLFLIEAGLVPDDDSPSLQAMARKPVFQAAMDRVAFERQFPENPVIPKPARSVRL